MSLKNPLSAYEKQKFWLNTDMYIDKAINSFLDADKSNDNSIVPLDYIRSKKTMAADLLESIMVGLGKVQKGKDEQGNPFPYQKALDEAKVVLDVEFPEPVEKSVKLEKTARWATLRFEILLNALKKDKPANVEFSG